MRTFFGLFYACFPVFATVTLAQPNDHYVHFGAANDVSFQTDRYYTGGLQLAYTSPVFNKFPLHRLKPFSKNCTTA